MGPKTRNFTVFDAKKGPPAPPHKGSLRDSKVEVVRALCVISLKKPGGRVGVVNPGAGVYTCCMGTGGGGGAAGQGSPGQ